MQEDRCWRSLHRHNPRRRCYEIDSPQIERNRWGLNGLGWMFVSTGYFFLRHGIGLTYDTQGKSMALHDRCRNSMRPDKEKWNHTLPQLMVLQRLRIWCEYVKMGSRRINQDADQQWSLSAEGGTSKFRWIHVKVKTSIAQYDFNQAHFMIDMPI